MIHLEEDADGLSLLIHDAKDEPQAYRLQARDGQFYLTREDTRDLYILRKEFATGWSCSCKSYECRKRWDRDDCKHTRAMTLIERFAVLLKQTEREEATSHAKPMK